MTAPFDPADWLWRFIGARGSVTPAPDCRVIAGWKLDDEAEWTAAKTIGPRSTRISSGGRRCASLCAVWHRIND